MRIVEYPKSDVEIEQEKLGFAPSKWWQATDSEGKLLAETSSRSDFEHLGLLEKEGVIFRRLYEKTKRRWVEEHPFPVQKEWRVIPSFPKYEMDDMGRVRLTDTKELLSGLFVGEADGMYGYLLRRGTVGSWLKTVAELLDETYPDLIEARKLMVELNAVSDDDLKKSQK